MASKISSGSQRLSEELIHTTTVELTKGELGLCWIFPTHPPGIFWVARQVGIRQASPPKDDIHVRPEGLTATVLLNREIREFHDWLKWPGMAEEVPPDVRDSQGPMVRLAPQVACAGLIRDPSQLRGELAGTRPS